MQLFKILEEVAPTKTDGEGTKGVRVWTNGQFWFWDRYVSG
jgi:hypothetical protein